MSLRREDVPHRVAKLLGHPVRWAPASALIGDYDGHERTLEVFNVPAHEQRASLGAIRSERQVLEAAAGGPIVVVFHTPDESKRLYSRFLAECIRERAAELSVSFELPGFRAPSTSPQLNAVSRMKASAELRWSIRGPS